MLRCKFRVISVTKQQGPGRQLKLMASNQKDGDNKDWSKWTPSGSLEFIVTNPDAFPLIDVLEPDQHVYLDISSVG